VISLLLLNHLLVYVSVADCLLIALILQSVLALDYILKWQGRRHPSFESFFPAGSSRLALDLISRMLQFHPDDRITVEDALAHPYLKDFRSHISEPSCDQLFNFDFERMDTPMSTELSKRQVQELMFEEALHFRPLAADAKGSRRPSEDKKGSGFREMHDNYNFSEGKSG
jgi:serine/threonine protein kinase